MSKSPERTQWRERVLLLLSIPLVCYLLQVGQYLWFYDENVLDSLSDLVSGDSSKQHEKTKSILLKIIPDLTQEELAQLDPELILDLLDEVIQSRFNLEKKYSDQVVYDLVIGLINNPDTASYFSERNISGGADERKLRVPVDFDLPLGSALFSAEDDIRFKYIQPPEPTRFGLTDETVVDPNDDITFFQETEHEVVSGRVLFEKSSKKLLSLESPELMSFFEILNDHGISINSGENIWLKRRERSGLASYNSGFENYHEVWYQITDSEDPWLIGIEVGMITQTNYQEDSISTYYDAVIFQGEGQFDNPPESDLEQMFIEAELAWERN